MNQRFLLRVVLVLLAATGPLSVFGQTPAAPGAGTTDLDALMARVLTNREQSWRRLQEYLLSERESFALVAPDGSRLFGSEREYLWVARDGRAVRSPVRVDGVRVGDQARREAEQRWLEQEDERAERAAKRAKEKGTSSSGQSDTRSDVDESVRALEPRFISEVNFLRFKFEPGNYYFVGRETLGGREVLRIEYYPKRLFTDDEREEERRKRERAKQDAERSGEGQREVALGDPRDIEQAFNKVSLVTLWVDPVANQIVRYTFDNVDFNFLPGRSFARVDTARASMTMGQPFEGIWLPESMVAEGAVTLATGTYRAEYVRRFTDYRQGDVKMRFHVKDEQ